GDADRDAIAATCLRACGLATAEIAVARRDAEELLAAAPAL
ncbi:TetR/AcrR family transcriptional regulator, partial [Clavibacter californiensis]